MVHLLELLHAEKLEAAVPMQQRTGPSNELLEAAQPQGYKKTETAGSHQIGRGEVEHDQYGKSGLP